MSLQTTYRTSQQRGMVGTVSRPNQSFGERLRVVAAAAPQPGQAYTLVAGVATLPADAAAAALAVGIMSFSQGALNAAIAQTENWKSGVVYVDGDEAPGMEDGNIYVLAGGAIKAGDALIYDTAADDWIPGVTTKAAFIADTDAADGDIVSVQINRIA